MSLKEGSQDWSDLFPEINPGNPKTGEKNMESEIRYVVRYRKSDGTTRQYGTPFATWQAAIACAARLSNAGLRPTVYAL